MASTVIQDFLATLGFKVDPQQQKVFNQSLTAATLNAKLLGDAIEKMAVSITKAVVNATSDMEALYYSSRRIKASAENIRAFEFAATQMGSSVEEANATLEAFALNMQTNPGFGTFAAQIAKIKVAGRDTVDVMTDVFRYLNNLPKLNGQPSLALVYASTLGVSQQQLRQMLGHQAEMEAWQAQTHRKAGAFGLDYATSTEGAHQLATSMRNIAQSIQMIFDKFLMSMAGPGGKAIQQLDKLLEANGSKIAESLGKVSDFFIGIANSFADWLSHPEKVQAFLDGLKAIIDSLLKLFGMASGIASFFGGWGNILEAFIAFKLIGWAARVLGIFTGLFGGIATAARLSGVASLFGIGAGALAAGALLGSAGSANPLPADGSPGYDETRGARRGGRGGDGAWVGDRVSRANNAAPVDLNGTTIPGLTAEQTQQYLRVLGVPESGNRYIGNNRLGYGGRWQMGPDEVRGTGVERDADWYANKGGKQDTSMMRYTLQHYNDFVAHGIIKPGMSPAQIAGILAAGHIGGRGGAAAAARGGEGASDANGTSAGRYYRMMTSAFNSGIGFGSTSGGGISSGSGTQLAFGDSIAAGLGLPGDAQESRHSNAILASIKALPEGSLHGKDVFLSGGMSNNVHEDPAIIGQMIDELKKRGANVHLLGVGTRSDFAGLNPKLRAIAGAHGAIFHELGPTRSDQVHPASYAALRRGLGIGSHASAAGHGLGTVMSVAHGLKGASSTINAAAMKVAEGLVSNPDAAGPIMDRLKAHDPDTYAKVHAALTSMKNHAILDRPRRPLTNRPVQYVPHSAAGAQSSIMQNNHITVGAWDTPFPVAASTSKEIKRRLADLTRNGKGAVNVT